VPKPIEPKPNNAECERILDSYDVGVLVMCREGEPYAVPMNHGYHDGKLYFHCATTGRKLDMIRANPRVTFVVSRETGGPSVAETSRMCHRDWESVIVYGSARVIEDPEELRRAFLTFGRHYDPNFEFSERALENTRAIIVGIDSMTARQEVQGKPVEYWSWHAGDRTRKAME
jgi:nitroimidazol reductase NimA-like FMN-containing flavoprotein (pyridoxamine 5'-phosphate oxidase superfamily)